MSFQINPFRKLLVTIHDKLGEEDTGKILLLIGDQLPEREIEEFRESKQLLNLIFTLHKRGIFSENNIEFMRQIFNEIHRKDILQIISKYEEEQGVPLQHSISASDDRLAAAPITLQPARSHSAPVSPSQGAANAASMLAANSMSSDIGNYASDMTESAESVVSYPSTSGYNGGAEGYSEAPMPLLTELMHTDGVLQTDGKVATCYKVIRQAVENSYDENETSMKTPMLSSNSQNTTVKSVLDVHHMSITVANAVVALYPYQQELIRAALAGRNSIICAPTGSGKTVAVGHAAYVLWKKAQDEGKKFVICFVVCIRCLVPQQEGVLLKMFGSDGKKVGAVRDTESLKGVLQKYDVVVLTGQVLVNGLNNKEVTFSDISLLIIDECHHTDLKHPYNRLMTMYMEQMHQASRPALPQIVGLTASLGVGDSGEALDHYIKLCANLNCMTIEHVREKANIESLLRENPPPSTDQIIEVPPRAVDDKFIVTLRNMMNQVNELFLQRKLRAHPGSQQYENDVINCTKEAEQLGQHDLALTFKMLKILNDAMLISFDFPVSYAVAYMKEKVGDVFVSDKCPTAKRVQQMLEAQELNISELSACDYNAKVTAFCNLLAKLFKTHSDAKGIVLTRMRINTYILAEMIKSNEQFKDVVYCERFVGKGSNQMTDEEQDAILKRFRSNQRGSVNLLIATDVAQEGLDLPACSFVIRYNFVSNEIGSVQSRGRARAKNSECYLIVDKGSVNARRERDNLLREHQMLETLDLIDQRDIDKLSHDIKVKQDQLWKEHLASQERQKLYNQNKTPAESVSIWCKCDVKLCYASDMIKKGDNLYVCDSETLPAKTYVEKNKKVLTYRYENEIGALKCSNCNQKLGRSLVFKQGRRSAGCLVFINNTVLYEMDGRREHITQWSKVPFKMKEESMTD